MILFFKKTWNDVKHQKYQSRHYILLLKPANNVCFHVYSLSSSL